MSTELLPSSCSESTEWRAGEPPLRRIVLLWNGKVIFGPVAFGGDAEREAEMVHLGTAPGGRPIAYLIIPKCNFTPPPAAPEIKKEGEGAVYGGTCEQCGLITKECYPDEDGSWWCTQCIHQWERNHGCHWEDGSPLTENIKP